MSNDFFPIALYELTKDNNCSFVVRDGNNVEWLCKEHEKPDDDLIMSKINELKNAEPMRLLRKKRNNLLLNTDKYMITDYPLTDNERNDMIIYRQKLRDLPQNNITEIPSPPETIKKYFLII